MQQEEGSRTAAAITAPVISPAFGGPRMQQGQHRPTPGRGLGSRYQLGRKSFHLCYGGGDYANHFILRTGFPWLCNMASYSIKPKEPHNR